MLFTPKIVEWTAEMDEVVRHGCSRNSSLLKAVETLGVSWYAVRNRVDALGLTYQSPGEWTEEEVKILKAEWEKGASGGVIAKLIGKSRNSIIGKAHRLKLASRGSGINRSGLTFPRKPAALPKPRIRRKPEAKAMVIAKKAAPPRFYDEPVPLTDKPPISIMELTDNTCRAPVGKDASGVTTYCGDQTFWDARYERYKPFCEGHCAMYYTPPEARRRVQ